MLKLQSMTFVEGLTLNQVNSSVMWWQIKNLRARNEASSTRQAAWAIHSFTNRLQLNKINGNLWSVTDEEELAWVLYHFYGSVLNAKGQLQVLEGTLGSELEWTDT